MKQYDQCTSQENTWNIKAELERFTVMPANKL